MSIPQSRILLAEEIKQVLNQLQYHLHLKAIFRLSCCCGLRSKEIRLLRLKDVVTEGPRPCVRVRAGTTKGKDGERKGRLVPLWWDQGTLADLKSYKASIGEQEYFLQNQAGKPYTRGLLARKWGYCVKCLGKERAAQLSIHCGRHSFASHSLHVGRSLIEVRDALGHSSVHMTSQYAHMIPREGVRDVFA